MGEPVSEITHNKVGKNGDIYIPDETVLDQEMNRILKRIQNAGKNGDIADLQAQIDMIAALLSHQNNRICREYIQRILPEILKVVKEQGASYNSRWVWGLTMLGGVLQIGSSAFGAYKFADAINNNTLKVANTIIQQVSKTTDGVSTFGNLLNQSGNLVKEAQRGDQEIRQYVIQVMNSRKDQNQQFGNTAEGKEGENLRALQQLYYSYHQTVSQVLGLSGG